MSSQICSTQDKCWWLKIKNNQNEENKDWRELKWRKWKKAQNEKLKWRNKGKRYEKLWGFSIKANTQEFYFHL